MTAPAMTAERALVILDQHIEAGHGLAKRRAGAAAKAYAKRGAPQVTADRMAEHARVRLFELEQARAFFAAMVERTTWRPIDTAPNDGTEFVGYREGVFSKAVRVQRDDFETWHFCGASGAVKHYPHLKPTHWMPLPADPEPQP